MKTNIRSVLAVAAACALFASTARAADSDSALVDFGKLKPAAGTEFVEVNIQSNLITMVTRLAEGAEPEVAEALRGLKQIRVNVIGLTDENRADIEKRITDIRSQLDAKKGWERIVTAMKDEKDVGVFVKTRGAEAIEGLVVTVTDGDEHAVLVNIIGDIRPEKLGMIGERFDIEPLKKLKIDGAKTKRASAE